MKKSLIALLLVVALVVTVSVFAVSAEDTNPFEGKTGTITATCPYCGTEVQWYPLMADTSSPINSGELTHLYLSGDAKTGSGTTWTTGEYCLNLNGYTWSRKTSGTFITLNGADEETAPTLNVFDTSTAKTGTMLVPFTGGSALVMSGCGTINVYSGNIIGGGVMNAEREPFATPGASSGTCVSIANTVTGGEVNLLGGTLQGKSKASGGVILVSGAVTLNIDGAAITGHAGGDTYGGLIRLNNNGAEVNMISGSVTGVAPVATTDISSCFKVEAGTLNVSGGTLTGISARGGAVYATGGTTVISGGTIQNCLAYNRGGSIAISSGSKGFTITGDAVIKDGRVAASSSVKFGGNIYTEGALTISGGNISGGGIEGTDYEDMGTFSTMRGGNVCARGGAVTMSAGTISGGMARIGGNVYLRNVTHSFAGGTISGGKASVQGGNIGTDADTNTAVINLGAVTIKDGVAYKGANIAATKGTMTLDGTTVSGGQATNQGGNIYVSNNATLTLQGNTVINGKNTSCHASAPLYGNNISVGDNDTGGTPGNLVVKGNTQIINGVGGLKDGYRSVILSAGSTVSLSDNAVVDRLYFRNKAQDTASVTINAGYAGKVNIHHDPSSGIPATVVPGADVHSSVVCNGYVGTATVYVQNTSNSQVITAWDATNQKLVVAGLAKVVRNADNKDVEYGIYSLAEAPALDEGYVKVYGTEATLNLVGDAIIDRNNAKVQVNTNGYKLSLIEYRSAADMTIKDSLTVDNEANLQRVTVNPLTKQQFVVVGDNTNGFTANYVKVSIDSVSIKPASASLYYTTNMGTTLTASQYAVSYGVVLSLVDMPAENFVSDDINGDKVIDNLYTEVDLELAEDERFQVEGANSALLEGILNQGAPEGQNKAWGELPIYANAYICFNIDGKDVYVMADKTYDLSLLDILTIVDETAPSNASVLKMYENWQDPMLVWATEPQDNENLPRLANIKAAYDEANA